ncbi:hypothetical protein BaRGS_00015407 [Batillaria attramentaria]|uniref:EF-hand domain-containing protein n=1 Tax=Batillaria attramentaria TaxID=370345 RepID=A0ABD0L213_9CAEN
MISMSSEFKITQKQYDDAQQTFSLFDKKGNGTVSTKDLGQVFKTMGYITWEQFKPVYELKLREDEDERELREAFRVLDKNNKGVIAVEDLRWILRSLGDDLTDEEIEDMIVETDTDGSGTVDYEGSYRYEMEFGSGAKVWAVRR